jgi:glycogen operon protein
MNMHWEMHAFELPGLPTGKTWNIFTNTDMQPPEDIWSPGTEKKLENQKEILVGPRSIVITVGK